MKKHFLCFASALTAAVMLASCTPGAATSTKTAEPTLPGTTAASTATEKSAEELVLEYRRQTDEKIAEIKASQNLTIPEGATVYYVSPNGTNKGDGKSPETAWKKLSERQNELLKPGDYVLFERGSIYRGNIAAVSGVTYSSYGEGEKPMLYGFSRNVGSPEYWRETDESGVWLFSLTVDKDIGNIVFGGDTMARKLNFDYAGDGSKTVHETGKEFSSYHDITDNMTFWHNPDGWGLYLRCNEGNPGEIWDDIEIAPYAKGALFNINGTDGVTVDNLVFKYAGGHAIGGGSANNLTVKRCEFYWIGGSAQYPERPVNNRLGNGVEIFGDCDGYIIEDSYFENIYDAAVTFQWTKVREDEPVNVMKNITFRNNVMEKCNYSIEYFQSTGDEGTYIGNIVFEGNLCWYAGEGLCSQRPDAGGECHIKSWGHVNNLDGFFYIRNNVFAYSSPYLVHIDAVDPEDRPELDGNVFIQEEGKPLAFWFDKMKNTTDEALEAFRDGAVKIIITKTK